MSIRHSIKQPMEGIRVLDLSHVLAGPYCTLMMALNGAEVIKIEPPKKGELFRKHLVEAKDGRKVAHSIAYAHRGKKAITLNLRSDKGREIFKELVKVSDVVLENFSAQSMDRLGLSYHTLQAINPALVYTSISGFGHNDIYPGPYVDRPAFNLVAQAMSGIMDITGEAGGPPIPTGVALGDLVASVFALAGTAMALLMRNVTGKGQHVDIAMYDCLASFSQRALLRYYLTGDMPTRGDDKRENPLGAFKVKDGYVVMTTMGDDMWARLCTLIGRPELQTDPRLNPDTARGRLYDTVLRPILEEWAKDRTRTEVVNAFQVADLPSAPVQSVADMLECPQLKARKMIQEFDDPNEGRLVLTGSPLKFSEVEEQEPTPAPRLGQDTDEVLQKLLGLSVEELAQLHEKEII